MKTIKRKKSLVSFFLLTSMLLIGTEINALADVPDTCQEQLVTISGTDHDDSNIQGTSGDDVIHGDAGHDIIRGNGGDDIICGGNGNDDIKGEAGHNQIRGGSGNDTSNSKFQFTDV